MNTYNITGMNCSACSSHIEQTVKKISGVTSCEVSLISGLMKVSGNASAEEIIRAVTELGYGISSVTADSNRDFLRRLTPSLKPVIIRFTCSLILLAILVYIATGHLMFRLPVGSFLSCCPDRLAYAEMILTTAILILNGSLLLKGYRGLVRMMPTMDSLVAIGVSASYLYSVNRVARLNTLLSLEMTNEAFDVLHNLYFESSAMLLLIVIFGKILEKKAQGKTTSALRGLLNITPKTAHRVKQELMKAGLTGDVFLSGTEDIDAEELQVNDIFTVLPGESVPADAVIIEGSGSVSEAALTGESMPRDVAEGDEIRGATLNVNGLLKCRAIRTGEETVFGKMVETVKEALSTRAPIARTADRISSYFVPGVIGIALLTFLAWYLMTDAGFAASLEYATAVLLVSCPCALGLATPMAITAGSGKALSNGILFKNAEALETIGSVRYAAMDKTGTVTAGTPKVTSVTALAELSEEKILHLAGVLESFSSHPVARAITAESGVTAPDTYGLMDETMTQIITEVFKEKVTTGLLTIRDFTEIRGGGVRARINNHVFLLGKPDFISTAVRIPAEVTEACNELAGKGNTTILLATSVGVLGIIAVNDVLKEHAAEAVAVLYRDGITPVMLTGDNVFSAREVADRVCIKNYKANCMPQNKSSVIRELKAKGRTAMVGDGINDALPLTEADVGIAVGSGSDIAVDAGSVVLVKSDLLSFVKAVRCGRITLKIIHQNLFWALCYNIVGIPLAAGAFTAFGFRLTPIFAAACMAVSSLIVVGNSLRIYLKDLSDETLLKEAAIEQEKIRTEGEGYFKRHRNVLESDKFISGTTHDDITPDEPAFKGFMGTGREEGTDKSKSGVTESAAENETATTTEFANIIIDGMVCEHCESTVCDIIRANVNTVNIVISHKKNAAVVEYTGLINEAALKRELSMAGYNLVRIFKDTEGLSR